VGLYASANGRTAYRIKSTTIKYLRRTTSGGAGSGLGTTATYLRRPISGAAGSDLGVTAKHLRRTTSGAAGNGLGTTIKYLRGAAGIDLSITIKCLRRAARQRPGNFCRVPAIKSSGDAGNGLGTTAKYLRRTTSHGLNRYRELLMCPFATSAPHWPCFVRASFANKQSGTTEVRCLGAMCVHAPFAIKLEGALHLGANGECACSSAPLSGAAPVFLTRRLG
jgi:hypothetical protein